MTEKELEELPKNEELEDDGDFDEDPEGKSRMISLFSYFVVMFVIGLPVWWETTRVYRAPLPIKQMFDVDIPDKTIRQNSIPLSTEYDILISIINPNPAQMKLDISARDIKHNLKPYLEKISTVANLTVKSQWIYLADLGVIPRNEGDYLALHEEQLPHVITPLEKKIWSHMSPRPAINLIVYMAQCDLPLYVYNKNQQRSLSNAFLSPGWGGIAILNADEDSCKMRLYKPDLNPIVNTFLVQIRSLLGLKSYNDEDIVTLKKVKAVEMIESTRRTLKSLAQLLSEISSIVISDEVGRKIEVALFNADRADELLRNGDINEAMVAAKIAYTNSEDAFSDPSLLALLYFPDDQKYAVYIPLFLPIMIPVVMSLITYRNWVVTKHNLQVKLKKKLQAELATNNE